MKSLKLIPVIDLQQGLVVHARLGVRSSYRPMNSPLCPSGDALELLTNLLDRFPFDTIYAADLDAILGRGDNSSELRLLRSRFPGIEFWVDAGIADERSLAGWLAQDLGRAVLGSESLLDTALLDVANRLPQAQAPVLSLDFRGELFLGPAALLDCSDCWPAHLILMQLTRVGSQSGPDIAQLERLKNSHAHRQFFAAGGVRNALDLARLANAGAAGALLATALHDGSLTTADLAVYDPTTA